MSGGGVHGNGAARERAEFASVWASLAQEFQPIVLEEIGDAELFHRYDTKYVVAERALPGLLRSARRHYRVLDVRGVRLAPYETVYYDTPGLDLYHAHYERRFPRAKVRLRTYRDTGQRFLERKVRESPRWSDKERWALDEALPRLMMDAAALPPFDEAPGPVHLVPAVSVCYHRVTLVARNAVERVTVDVGVSVARGGEAASFPGAAVVEVKQPGPAPSPMRDALASLSLRPRGLSKYCLAIAAVGNGARTDRFLPLVRHLEHIGNTHGKRAEG